MKKRISNFKSQIAGGVKGLISNLKFQIVLSVLFVLFLTPESWHLIPAFAQQPQAQPGQLIYNVNAKLVNGVAPGYWPTAGSGLTLNLSAGTVYCFGSVYTYAGGTLTMTASTANYVFLNISSSCAPASSTSGFGSNIPIAVVTAGTSAITGIQDVRLAPGSALPALTLDNVPDGPSYFWRNPQYAVAEFVENGNFDSGSGSTVPGWRPGNGATISIDGTTTPTSGDSLELVSNGSTTYGFAMHNRFFRVTPGEAYALSVYVLSDGTSQPDVELQFHNSSGTILGTVTVDLGAGLPTSWSYSSASGSVPSGANWASLVCQNVLASGTAHFKGVRTARLRNLANEVYGTLTPSSGASIVVYNTPSASTNASISTTTMATAPSSGTAVYRYTEQIDVTAAGVGCTGNTLIQPSVIFTDPNASSPTGAVVSSWNFSISGNGMVGASMIISGVGTFATKAGTNIQYNTSYNIGTGCTTGPSYQIYPVLERVM